MTSLVRVIVEPADALDKLMERIRQPREVHKVIGIIVRREFARNIAAGGRPEKWEPLSPNYLAWKQKLFDDGKIRGRNKDQTVARGKGELPGILVLTGALRLAYCRRGAPGNVFRSSDDGRELEVGADLPYTGYHEDGTRGGKVIRPKQAKALRFYTVNGWVFANRVVMKPLARRSMLYIGPEGWRDIDDALAAYFAGDNPRTLVGLGSNER